MPDEVPASILGWFERTDVWAEFRAKTPRGPRHKAGVTSFR